MIAYLLNFITYAIIAVLSVFTLRRWLFASIAVLGKIDRQLNKDDIDIPEVLILIPCHNEERVISNTLHALLSLEFPKEKLAIVAIDDLSTDNTLAIIKEFEHKYDHIHVHQRSADERRGKAAALNSAIIKYTKGQIIYFLDADHSPKPDSLLRLIRHFENPRIGAVNGWAIPWNKDDSLIANYVYLENLVHNRITMYASDRLGMTAAIQGSNFCIRRDLLVRIGWFNEEHLTEDLELTINIYSKGYSVKFDVTAITEHEVPNTIMSYIFQHLRWNRGFNKVSRNRWREILKNKNIDMAQRAEMVIFSLGYIDRIFFCLAMILSAVSVLLTSDYRFPYWIWPFVIGAPAFSILAGLMAEKTRLSSYFKLPFVLSMFSVDIYVAVAGQVNDLLSKPTIWYKTKRR